MAFTFCVSNNGIDDGNDSYNGIDNGYGIANGNDFMMKVSGDRLVVMACKSLW